MSSLRPHRAGFTRATANLGAMEQFPRGHGNDHGILTIAGERVDLLAEQFDTPLLVLDMREVAANVAALQRACSPHGIAISYAGKALLVSALARRIAGMGLGIDVCSLGELATCERAGIASSRLTLHGAGKRPDELQAALDGRVGRIIVDSLDELRRLIALEGRRELQVLLRLNTGIEAHTHDFVRTAGDDSKFGIAPHEERDALSLLASAPHLKLRGLHSHIGSQIYEVTPFAANAQQLMEAARRFMERGARIDTLVLGGGFGIPTRPDAGDEVLDVDAAMAGMAWSVRDAAELYGLAVPALEIEPGRSIVANAGTSIYRVMAIKRFDRRRFVVVDGGMADNPRPALYGAKHHVVPVRSSDAAWHEATLCGRSCENDEMGTMPLPDDLHAGDLLAVCSAGAYTYSMASNYNRFARPAIVAVGEGAPCLYARRESLEDILRCDVDA